MALIPLPAAAPGIRGLLQSFPESGRSLSALAQTLLRGDSPLSPGERETVAVFVAARNGCAYCARSHGEAARKLLRAERGEGAAAFEPFIAGAPPAHGAEGAPRNAPPPHPKLAELLGIADTVRVDARSVGAADVERARALGADDRTIHDTVLIAAAILRAPRASIRSNAARPAPVARPLPCSYPLQNAM